MTEYSMYFAKPTFYNLIRECGGVWNDSKERPLVCLIQIDKHSNIYWAVPMGNFNHRDIDAQNRIRKYINLNSKDIRSCYYHIGRTTTQSIFFISDVVPITQKYIDRIYNTLKTNTAYVIKNSKLQNELVRKVKRILKFENNNPNSFRQHITDVKNYLIQEELNEKQKELQLNIL